MSKFKENKKLLNNRHYSLVLSHEEITFIIDKMSEHWGSYLSDKFYEAEETK